MDYYHFTTGTTAESNAKAIELIFKDEHDFIVFFSSDYDTVMHKRGPEDPRALAELRVCDAVFSLISDTVKNALAHRNVLIGLTADHGCHEIDGGRGSHGSDRPEDINIVHLYRGYPKK